MRKKKISEIISYLDGEYVNEATDYTKLEPSKRSSWLKWGILAACFVVAILAGAILFPSVWKSNTSRELLTIAEMNRPYKGIEVNEISFGDNFLMGDDGKWPAEYMTLAECCDHMTFQDNFYAMYGYTQESFVGEVIGEGECTVYDSASRGQEHVIGTETFEVHKLEGVSEEMMVVVDIDGEFCLYKNRYRQSTTLGELIEVYNLSQSLELNYFSKYEAYDLQDYFSLTDDAYIWEVLAECKDAKLIENQIGHSDDGNFIRFTVTAENLDIYKKTFRVEENGYLYAYFVGDGGWFFIGEEAAEKIISYATKYGRKTEKESDDEPYLVGTIIEMEDDYILVDDSVLCENPEDGIVFKVPTEEFKIRRYVDYQEMQVGDLIWVNFGEGIDVKAGNLVYGVSSIYKAAIFESFMY